MAGREHLRAADADRERAVRLLRRHHADGRLDDDELEERIAAAYAARTYGALDALLADLPATPAGGLAALDPVPAAAAPVAGLGARDFHQVHDSPRALDDVWDDLERRTVPSLARFGYRLEGFATGRSVDCVARVRPWWTIPASLVFLPFSLLVFLVTTPRRLRIEVRPRSGGGTRIVVFGRASRPVRRFLAELGPAHAS